MKKYIPSNGTEGMIFYDNWCEHCEKDREWSEAQVANIAIDPMKACQILTKTMVYDVDDPKYPEEWVYVDEDDIFKGGKCTAFEQITEPPTPAPFVDTKTIDMFD